MLIVLFYEMFMQYPVILLILMQVRICMLMGVIISMMSSCMNVKLNPENSVMKELYTACYKGIRCGLCYKTLWRMQLLMRIYVAGVWMRQ